LNVQAYQRAAENFDIAVLWFEIAVGEWQIHKYLQYPNGQVNTTDESIDRIACKGLYSIYFHHCRIFVGIQIHKNDKWKESYQGNQLVS
jgi:hypothetical protein